MMSPGNRRKNIEREERLTLRHERETAAGKLLEKVPHLTSLSLAIDEARPDGWASDAQYIRRVVVEHAAALFEVPCSYAYCKDGGYDMTREILDSLASRKARFEGERACRGSCGTGGDCTRVLRYVATATYRPRPDDA
jgi:hypothetical protein